MTDLPSENKTLPSSGLDALRKKYLESHGDPFASLGGIRNFVTFGGKEFNLNRGGVVTTAPGKVLDVAVLAANPRNHRIWYEKDYNPKSPTAEAPTAIWMEGDALPANVPEWVVTQKVIKGGYEVNHYQVRRRLVVALIAEGSNGARLPNLDEPFIMDITGMSLFGKPKLATPVPHFSFTGLKEYCDRHSVILPEIPLRLVFTSNSVPQLAFIPFVRGQSPFFFQGEVAAAIIARGLESDVVQALNPIRAPRGEIAPAQVKPNPLASAAPAEVTAPVADEPPTAPTPEPEPEPKESVAETVKKARATAGRARKTAEAVAESEPLTGAMPDFQAPEIKGPLADDPNNMADLQSKLNDMLNM
jgi:hypothetical protein